MSDHFVFLIVWSSTGLTALATGGVAISLVARRLAQPPRTAKANLAMVTQSG